MESYLCVPMVLTLVLNSIQIGWLRIAYFQRPQGGVFAAPSGVARDRVQGGLVGRSRAALGLFVGQNFGVFGRRLE